MSDVSAFVNNLLYKFNKLSHYLSKMNNGILPSLYEFNRETSSFMDLVFWSKYPKEFVRAVIVHEKIKENVKGLELVYQDFWKKMEYVESVGVKDVKDLAFTQLDNFYHLLVGEEIKACGLRDGDRLAFVGSGPFPQSLVNICLYCKRVGIRLLLYGIEKDPEAFKCSKDLVSRLKLNIDLVLADAAWHNFNGYSVVILAAQLSDKSAILKNLEHKFPKKCVIYRTMGEDSCKLYKMFCCNSENVDMPITFKLDLLKKYPLVIPDSYLLRKRSREHV